MTYQDKVYYYLQNMETRSKDKADAYKSTEKNNKSCSEVSTDNFLIETVNGSNLYTEFFPGPVTDENNIRTNFVEKNDMTDFNEKFPEGDLPTNTKMSDSVQNPLYNLAFSNDITKINILDYKIFPPKKSIKLADNICKSNIGAVKNTDKFVNERNETKVRKYEETYYVHESKSSILNDEISETFSDEDYVPPSIETNDSSSNFGSDEKLCDASIKVKINEIVFLRRNHDSWI